MHISIEWHKEQININLSNTVGSEAFLSIKGCRVMEHNGKEFIAFPSRKMDNGKYWNHVWANDKFQAYVIDIAKKAKPQTRADAERAVSDMADDVPFANPYRGVRCYVV